MTSPILANWATRYGKFYVRYAADWWNNMDPMQYGTGADPRRTLRLDPDEEPPVDATRTTGSQPVASVAERFS